MRLKLLLCMVVVNFAVPSGILLDRVQGVSKLSLCLRGGLDFYPSSSWEDEYKHLHPDRLIFDHLQDQFDRRALLPHPCTSSC
mmetsp:Transcript_18433/g.60537  ORF Transcript_18433/g.60537 Transcript_18433/m.60537 type:complete len:83 (+) Transcript_18433:96-344(+)